MATTWWAGKAPGYAARLALGGAIGLLWRTGSAGAMFSPLLVALIPTGETASKRWIGAFGYFLGGAWDLPAAAATFFAPGQASFGPLLWLSSAALLALPWAWAASCSRAVATLAISALPPLGMIGWLSPLTAAGLWFPGMGWMGLLLILGVCWTLGERRWIGVLALGLGSCVANRAYSPPRAPPGWIGVNTQVGAARGDFMAQYARLNAWISQVRRQSRGANVVVLPETIAANGWDGTRFVLRQAIPPGQTWLVGISIRNHQGLWDAIALARTGQVESDPLFRAVLPVPLSMWTPWTREGYEASWWPALRTIEGQPTLAVICYDQLLVWPWLEALLQHPRLIIAPSNSWWARQSRIPTIEATSSLAWTRLMGVALISAQNASVALPSP